MLKNYDVIVKLLGKFVQKKFAFTMRIFSFNSILRVYRTA